MYDKEPEIVKPIAKPRITNSTPPVSTVSTKNKKYIAFTSQCTYRVIDEHTANTNNFLYVAPIPDNYYLYARRSEFKNAYSTHAPLIWLKLFEADEKIAVFSSIKKAVVFNTNLINPVNSTTSKGVMVQKAKNNSTISKVELLKDAGLTDVDYYRCANIPATGVYLKK